MSAVEVLPELFFVERGFLNANHFVYRSAEPVLIDTAYQTHARETEAAIRALGADPSRTRMVVTTHCHCDHVGLTRRVQTLSGCDVALHPAGKAFMDRRDGFATWWDYFGQEAEFFEGTRELSDGEELAVGPHRFRVIHTPGHSADGLVLHHEAEGVLLSSDVLWADDVAAINERVEGDSAVEDLLASLERLEALEVRIVFPGHGPPFSGYREALQRSKKRIRGYLAAPERVGEDMIKRIMVYTLLMLPPFPVEAFFPHLMGTRWYPETVDRYFGGGYREKYDQVLGNLVSRSVIRIEDGRLRAAVPA